MNSEIQLQLLSFILTPDVGLKVKVLCGQVKV